MLSETKEQAAALALALQGLQGLELQKANPAGRGSSGAGTQMVQGCCWKPPTAGWQRLGGDLLGSCFAPSALCQGVKQACR